MPLESNAWPFEEARKIVARLRKHPKDEVIFETGYGPSGLPHIGTFGEDNRAGIERTLHRISAIRNRRGETVAVVNVDVPALEV